LSGIARSQGVQELEAYVMGENQRMIEVLEHSGFRVRRRYEDGTIRFVLPLGGCTGAGRPSPPRS
jgi:RimJ/RimL family protein N-acetyltransferase